MMPNTSTKLRTFIGFCVVAVFAPQLLSFPGTWERLFAKKLEKKP